MQEEANISRVRNGDVTLITKPEQAQVPHNDHTTPDSDIKTAHSDDDSADNNNNNSVKGQPARDDIGTIDNSSNHNRNIHPCEASEFGTDDNGNVVYDLGGEDISIKDDPTCDVGDSASSNSNVSCVADTFPTNAHDTDATGVSFEATDDDEDFAQCTGSHRDRRLHVRYRTGKFDAANINIKRSNSKSIPGNHIKTQDSPRHDNDSDSSSDSAPCTTTDADTHGSDNSDRASTIATASLATAAFVTATHAPSTSCLGLSADISPRFSNNSTDTSSSNFNSSTDGIASTPCTLNDVTSSINNKAGLITAVCTVNADAVTDSNASSTDSGADTSLPIRTPRTTSSTDNRSTDDNAKADANSSGSNSIYDTNPNTGHNNIISSDSNASIITIADSSLLVPTACTTSNSDTNTISADTDVSDSISSSNSTEAANIFNIARTLNAVAANSSNSNSGPSNNVSTVSTTCATSAFDDSSSNINNNASAISIARTSNASVNTNSSGNSTCLDTGIIDPASPICKHPSAMHNNEPEYECARIPPFDASDQVHLLAAPHVKVQGP